MNDLRVILSEEDFKELVSGHAVQKPGVGIILSDIGFDRMFFHIERAMRDSDSGDLV